MGKNAIYLLLLIPPIIMLFMDFTGIFNTVIKTLSVLTIVTCIIGLIRNRKLN